MNQANRTAGFGGLFPALAGQTAPGHELLTRRPAYRAPVATGLGRRLRALRQAFERRRERARTRRALAQLDDRLLRDIGLSRADLGIELEPPFPGLGEALPRDHGAGRRADLGEAGVGLWHL